MYFAILKHNNRQYFVVGFHDTNERDTFIKNAGFEKLPCDKIYRLNNKEVIRKCRANERVVFDQNGMLVTRINSLYKPLHQQNIYRPEDSISHFTRKAFSKSVVNGRRYRKITA